MPGGFEDRMQRAQLLREMDHAPRHSGRTHVPNPRYYNADNMALSCRQLGSAELLAAAASAAVGRDPASYQEAMGAADAAEWAAACEYEMDALSKNGTWELVDLLSHYDYC